ncbi:hypothetical protein KIW84_051974 [Lathyrus oleraceus]|uniref:WRKY domain-containing protein n=1 Tax=Pisum sativum TaxID=3888 RepID=A0A9D4WLF8_PEA|nr:hypothetical protein KIW84_051974 [Pisum sativum]
MLFSPSRSHANSAMLPAAAAQTSNWAKAILLPQGTSSTVQPVIQNAMDIFTSSGTAQTQQHHAVSASNTSFQSSNVGIQQQQPWSYQESTKQEGYSSGNNMMQGENNNTSMQIYSPEFANVQMNTTMMNNNGVQSDFNNYQAVPLQQVQTLSKKSDDGYNWRKYGQKTSERK